MKPPLQNAVLGCILFCDTAGIPDTDSKQSFWKITAAASNTGQNLPQSHHAAWKMRCSVSKSPLEPRASAMALLLQEQPAQNLENFSQFCPLSGRAQSCSSLPGQLETALSTGGMHKHKLLKDFCGVLTFHLILTHPKVNGRNGWTPWQLQAWKTDGIRKEPHPAVRFYQEFFSSNLTACLSHLTLQFNDTEL